LSSPAAASTTGCNPVSQNSGYDGAPERQIRMARTRLPEAFDQQGDDGVGR
jgi:hypothetical protein